MAKQQLTSLDFNNVSAIINLPDGVNPQDAVTVAQLRSAIEGLSWKTSVVVASTANINLASPGASIDGVTLTNGDRFLAKDQTTASSNGIYVFNGASVAATRALDASTSQELEQAIVTVEQGTSAGSAFRQTSVNFTLDSGAVSFVSFGTAAPAATESTAGISEIATQAETDTGTDNSRFVTPAKLANWSGKPLRYAANIGDGSATQFTVTHNLNTRDCVVAIYRNSGAYDEVITDVEHTTVNSLTIRFSSAPTANQFRVVVRA